MLFKWSTFHNFPLRIFDAAQYFPSHLSEALHSGHCATAEISAFSSSFRFSLSFTSIIATFCDLRCQTDFTLCNTYFTFLIFLYANVYYADRIAACCQLLLLRRRKRAKSENGERRKGLPSAAYVLTAPRRCTRFRDEFGKTFAEKILFCFCQFLRDGRSFSPPAPVYIIPYFSRFEVSNILYIV